MRGFIDLHSHWVAGVDDGAETVAEGYDLVRALFGAGFDHVVATPHMRPGMFDNDRAQLVAAFEATRMALQSRPGPLPTLSLGSEHFFDDVVFERFRRGEAIPYPGGKAALVEFHPVHIPTMLTHRLNDLMRLGIRPVIAHPERYEPVWKDPQTVEPWLDVGAVLLLDIQALVGKYGRRPEKAARALLAQGSYYAACSDAHGAEDVLSVREGMAALAKIEGEEEVSFLLREGPTHILEGRVRQG